MNVTPFSSPADSRLLGVLLRLPRNEVIRFLKFRKKPLEFSLCGYTFRISDPSR